MSNKVNALHEAIAEAIREHLNSYNVSVWVEARLDAECQYIMTGEWFRYRVEHDSEWLGVQSGSPPHTHYMLRELWMIMDMSWNAATFRLFPNGQYQIEFDPQGFVPIIERD